MTINSKGAKALHPLLQILQDATVTKIVDVPAEIHQLRVDVCGHTAVGRRGKVGAAGHHAGTARRGTFSTPLHQGTKSRKGEENVLKGNFPASPPSFKHSNLKLDFHKGYHGKCSLSYVPANSLTVVVSPVCDLQKKKKEEEASTCRQS